MHDQADELRNLMLKVARQNAAQNGPSPRLVLVCGGKGGVGATTLAVNLAVALAHQAARTVLVDADLYRADAAALCGVAESTSIAELLGGGRDIHEVLQRGPAGIQLVPGVWAPDQPSQPSEGAQRRLLAQLSMLGRHADVVVIDTGGAGELPHRFWRAADDVVMVSTPEAMSVMDAYATIKTLRPPQDAPRMWLAVNRAADARQCEDVHARINQSCRRFLETTIGRLGYVVEDPSFARAARAATPLVVLDPESEAARQVEQLAAELMAGASQRRRVRSAVA
ncbi:MAG: P-loop NTPase [Pirellulaceae bacterium]